jgi:hypothetical protein
MNLNSLCYGASVIRFLPDITTHTYPLKDRQENAALADQADVFTHPEEKQ